MALRADVDAQFFLCGAGRPRLAACAVNRNLLILGMNVCFHELTSNRRMLIDPKTGSIEEKFCQPLRAPARPGLRDAEEAYSPVDAGAKDCRGRDRQEPDPDDLSPDAPPAGREPQRRSHTDHDAGYGVVGG